MAVWEESRYSEPLAEFAQLVNRRNVVKLQTGKRWVRVRPPDAEDLSMASRDPRAMPFIVPGSACEVVDLGPNDYVTIRVGKDSFIFAKEYFLSSYIRLFDGSDWASTQDRIVSNTVSTVSGSVMSDR